MEDFARKKCKPCEGGAKPLNMEQARKLMSALDGDWQLDEVAETIERHFDFKAFSRTMSFVNVVAWVATNEGHHPQLIVNYGSCDVQYRTHAVDGLSDNDFICAAKIDRLMEDF